MIGELADGLKVSLRSLRHYESVGLLAPRRIGRQRVYDTAQRTRAQAIVLLRGVDLSLREISRFMDSSDPEADRAAALAARLRDKLRETEDRAEQLRKVLRTVEDGVLHGADPNRSARADKAAYG